MPRLDLNYRRGNRNLTDFDEVLDLIKVNSMYTHIRACVWREREYINKNACIMCLCVIFTFRMK